MDTRAAAAVVRAERLLPLVALVAGSDDDDMAVNVSRPLAQPAEKNEGNLQNLQLVL